MPTDYQAVFDHFFQTFSFETLGLAKLKEKYHAMMGGHEGAITEIPYQGFNCIRLQAESSKLIEQLGALQIPCLYLPGRDAETHMAVIAEQTGLEKICDCVASRYDALNDFQYSPLNGFELIEVNTPESLSVFSAVAAESFDQPETLAHQFIEHLSGSKHIHLYIGMHEGIPVACGALSYVHDTAGLYYGGVLPKYRRRGFGTALTQYRMNEAQTKGFTSICAQNMPASISYYERIGFKAVGQLPIYANVIEETTD